MNLRTECDLKLSRTIKDSMTVIECINLFVLFFFSYIENRIIEQNRNTRCAI